MGAVHLRVALTGPREASHWYTALGLCGVWRQQVIIQPSAQYKVETVAFCCKYSALMP